jgi:hypothetical protein
VQGVARILSGGPDEGDGFLADAVSIGKDVSSAETVAAALCERSLAAMARGEWPQAEGLAGQAHTILRQAGIERSYVTPLACAVHAHTALHRGDVTAARQELINAQQTRALLTYALPHIAVQARIELVRACIMLTDLPAARTLMREIDEVLQLRPDLGTLNGQTKELRAQLSKLRGRDRPGPSALTAAELRLLHPGARWITECQVDAGELDPGLNGVIRQRAGQLMPQPLGANQFLACRVEVSPLHGGVRVDRTGQGGHKGLLDPARRNTVRARSAKTRAFPHSPRAIVTSARSHSATAATSGAPVISATLPASSSTAVPPSMSPERTRATPCMSPAAGSRRPSAANRRAASSASASICFTPC